MIKNAIVLCLSILFCWIVVNVYLYFDMALDGRSRVTKHFEEWRKKPDITPHLAPQAYARNDLHDSFLDVLPENIQFPLGAVPNVRTIYCEEDEGWYIEKSDRFGFFNADENWDFPIDILLVGDSFTQGACTAKNIKYWLEKITSQNIISLGQGGNGSLIEYAGLRELLNFTTPKKIFWLVVSNDITDLEAEAQDETLKRYLDDKNFSQNYFDLDLSKYTRNTLKAVPPYLELNKGNITNNYLKMEPSLIAIIRGRYLVKRIKRFREYKKWLSSEAPFVRSKVESNPPLELMTSILLLASEAAKKRKVIIKFILVPSQSHCYRGTIPNHFYDLIEFFEKNELDYLDGFPITEGSFCDSLYATKRGGHLNHKGYQKLAEFIESEIQ